MTGESWLVTMPKLGETVTEGTVFAWLKNVGDTVEFDDPLFEVETDKVTSEFPSPYDGVVLEILIPAEETVPVSTALLRIGEPGSIPGDTSTNPTQYGTAMATSPVTTIVTQPSPGLAPLAAGGAQGRLYSPIVRRLAADNSVDLSAITGSGAGGRIRREDVESVIVRGPVASSPPPKANPTAAPSGIAALGDPRDEIVKLTPTRLAVAAGMVNSLQTAPQVWTSVEVDYENIEQVRRKYKVAFKEKPVLHSVICLSWHGQSATCCVRHSP